MNILGIETSCDETSVAIVRHNGAILSNLIYSQAKLHAQFGGVVPEVASRDHLKKLPLLAQQALHTAGVGWSELGAVAVTSGPGLIGPLLVGVSYAKGVSWGCDVPLLGVNHLAAHLFAHRLAYPQVEPPFLGLIASGGHTTLVQVAEWGSYRTVGSTRDDAAGEALDKFGRLVGLGYPAGPKIDELAARGNPRAVSLPRPLLETGLDMSFAGLKTAAVYWLRVHPHFDLADLCASYLEAVVDVLAEKSVRAARLLELERIVVVGGVAANRRLRDVLPERAGERALSTYFPPVDLCTDNAAMVAACGHHRFIAQGRGDPPTLRPDAGMRLPS